MLSPLSPVAAQVIFGPLPTAGDRAGHTQEAGAPDKKTKAKPVQAASMKGEAKPVLGAATNEGEAELSLAAASKVDGDAELVQVATHVTEREAKLVHTAMHATAGEDSTRLIEAGMQERAGNTQQQQLVMPDV